MAGSNQIINARIFYDVHGSTPTGFDPVTDEPIFTNTELFVECSLEPDETEPRFWMNYGGVDEIELRLSGRAINPSILPVEIKPNAKYKIEYEFSTNVWREARCHVYTVMQSKLTRARSKYGDWILVAIMTAKGNQV